MTSHMESLLRAATAMPGWSVGQDACAIAWQGQPPYRLSTASGFTVLVDASAVSDPVVVGLILSALLEADHDGMSGQGSIEITQVSAGDGSLTWSSRAVVWRDR